MKITQLFAVLFLIVLAVESTFLSAANELPQTTLKLKERAVTFSIKEKLTGLRYPWAVAELPDGSLLITEKKGALKHLKNDGTVQVISGLPSIYVESQGGLLDLVLHPEFSKNQVLFMSYAHGDEDANTTRLMRAKLQGKKLVEQKVLFEVEPFKDTPVHYGGRIAVLPGDTLVMTTGDGFDYREEAQKLNSLLGKSIRVTFNGDIPKDNPFISNSSARAEIWTYGHRNPQGIVFDKVEQKLWMHEHGPAGGDEINLIEPGVNYGWPVITQGKDYSGAVITPFEEYDGMRQPQVNWTPSIAPSGLDVYRNDLIPELTGALLVGALVDRCIYVVFPDNNFHQETFLGELNFRVRDILVRANGNILVLTDSDKGKLLELVPETPAPKS